MSPVIHCCVLLVLVAQLLSAKPLWTKSQMEYLEHMKQDYKHEIGKNKMAFRYSFFFFSLNTPCIFVLECIIMI